MNNVPELVRNGQYYQNITTIKNYENTIQQLFLSTKKSQLADEPYTCLWKITHDGENSDLFPNIRPFELNTDIFVNKNLSNNIVVTGPLIRHHFIPFMETYQNQVRKELYLYIFGNEEWSDIIDFSLFQEFQSEFIYETNETKICLIKKKYKTPSQILLQHGFLKRVGWIGGDFYVSSMFIIEFQKHIDLFNQSFVDPIFGYPYDPLDVYHMPKQDTTHPIKLIDMADLEHLLKMKKKNFNTLYVVKGKTSKKITCIEYCLEKYVREQHPIFISQIKQMILYLNEHVYIRPPFLYAKMLKMNDSHKELYELLLDGKNKYNIEDTNFTPSSINNLDMYIVEHCIKNDKYEWLITYIEYIGSVIDSAIIKLIIKYMAIHILKRLIVDKVITDLNLMYYAIFMTQEIDLFKHIDYNNDLAVNYVEDILKNSLIRSFYFIVKMDQSIINMSFDGCKNILHYVSPNNSMEITKNLIELINRLKPELIDLKDDNNETPILYHSKHNPTLIGLFLEFDFDSTILDNDGNSFMHHLCKHNQTGILKNAIKKFPALLNLPNKNSESPAIIACQSNHEDMFYTLKGFGADMNAQDRYGNTVYHYICNNSMCLAMIIDNTKNYFGLTPENYCKKSKKYYEFI